MFKFWRRIRLVYIKEARRGNMESGLYLKYDKYRTDLKEAEDLGVARGASLYQTWYLKIF